ncbi:bifunctional proline dehydrogenase/L-glutamate gamma-semialdehyde dehydrogenase PutA [Deefgea rivuli]|uniref:bifunctional proline dehydrogenase/L-glutamate gamma-semialdehyde dehydrogenase PutA n=1 Tax=Deefgea rivuli TaxID=400948 RepID=UPI0006883AA2|nr:bifunctional proline dehydrogenase/L-glutamate gamma-semialdehyde dehydrogenase PutA [Deefgea rivuli]
MHRDYSAHSASPPSLERIFSQRYRNETELARELSQTLQISSDDQLRADALARIITERLRLERINQSGLDAILAEFPLSSSEGKALLNLAEALLRIPDQGNANQLLREQLHAANWLAHRGHSPSWQVNLAAWGLSLADSISNSSGKPIAREIIKQAIGWLGQHFIIAENIEQAVKQTQTQFLYSYDILGEAALSTFDSDGYFAKYTQAIHHIGQLNQGAGVRFGAGVSIKLSALHPRFEHAQQQRLNSELYPRLLELALLAKQYDIGLTIDAEECERLEITLRLFGRLAFDNKLGEWAGLGIAVQAYQKRALSVIQWLCQLSLHRPLVVRLVKGAYWDSEIKWAQHAALVDYPVFTHKSHTDLSYLACAQTLLHAEHRIYPQFATHNPFTLSLVHQMAGERDCEFQGLFGMGEALYSLIDELGVNRPCRIYAPIGEQAALLPYLIRRFLENGANTSFVHQLLSPEKQTHLTWPTTQNSPAYPKPNKLTPSYETPSHFDWTHQPDLTHFQDISNEYKNHSLLALPMIGHGLPELYEHKKSFNPADQRHCIGLINEGGLTDIEKALSTAIDAQALWATTSVIERAALLEKTAEYLLEHRIELMTILIHEAGKTLDNAQNEVREAIDFCRYYAQEARQQWQHSNPKALGVVVAISPWNFPLAIYVGQIACGLIAGNAVVAKPAPETPLVAMLATRCFYKAGFSRHILQFIPGGAAAGAALLLDRRCNGVLFTGALQTAQKISHDIQLAGGNKAFISETGSVNCMLVDSSAQIDQVCKDVLTSAFDSTGQRCSALRILWVQEEIADETVQRIKRAMAELKVGNPAQLRTDIGPVISQIAANKINQAIRQYHHCAIYQTPLSDDLSYGFFISPTLIELGEKDPLPAEIFGPVLFVKRFKMAQLDQTIQAINQLDTGLTLGIQSRLTATVDRLIAGTRIGNYYINRTQIGAIVASQPFGGTGNAGSGPKTGGPWSIWAATQDGDPCQAHEVQTSQCLNDLTQLLAQWDNATAASLKAQLDDVAQRTPIGCSITLPSITGESNTLNYRGLGRIACLADEPASLFELISVALLTGNIPVIRYLPNPWREALKHHEIEIRPNFNLEQIDGILCQQREKRPYAISLLTPIITPLSNGQWPLFRLVSEYTITTNTAAMGGDLPLICDANGYADATIDK